MAANVLSDAWSTALTSLDSMGLGPAAASFLAMAKPLGDIEGTILVAVPNEFTKGYIENRASEGLTHALSEALGRDVRIAVTIDASLAPDEEEDEEVAEPTPPPLQTPRDPDVSRTLDAVNIDSTETHLNPKYTFDTFVTGPSNRFTHAAAIAVAEAPAKAYNPLFIYGDSGLGKTHLMHAIGHYALSLYPHLRVRYVNSEEFTNDFINALQEGRINAFQRRYREVDILLIDDIQFIQGKEQTMDEFFHTFNTLHNANKQVVLTSDLPPKQLDGFEDRLRSRFEAGLLADVQPPDLETRIAILQKKAAAENLEVDPAVLEYIASRISSNIRELEGCLLRVTAFANLTQQRIDLPLAEMVLKDIISDPQDTEITAALIMGQTAHYFGVTIDQLCSSDRSRTLVEARQIAMYLCRELTDLSLPKIGAAFGGRDHTTVMHANKKIGQQMNAKRETFNHVTELTNRIKQKARES
ncbi:MAG: chromosomal replication initiator protein DnaA [Actinomyces sp.]|nr:chromosomal replication initiator protein DnaA [Actinomyces sp.]MCI1788180.1 chromosomal replication initiator protein DnaA [Actinomyces sp.]